MVIGDFVAWNIPPKRVVDDVMKCVETCWGKRMCMDTCGQKIGAYTSQCGQCVGDMGECATKRCWKICTKGKEDCLKCVQKHCLKDLLKCVEK